jgi:hypothetical protein
VRLVHNDDGCGSLMRRLRDRGALQERQSRATQSENRATFDGRGNAETEGRMLPEAGGSGAGDGRRATRARQGVRELRAACCKARCGIQTAADSLLGAETRRGKRLKAEAEDEPLH